VRQGVQVPKLGLHLSLTVERLLHVAGQHSGVCLHMPPARGHVAKGSVPIVLLLANSRVLCEGSCSLVECSRLTRRPGYFDAKSVKIHCEPLVMFSTHSWRCILHPSMVCSCEDVDHVNSCSVSWSVSPICISSQGVHTQVKGVDNTEGRIPLPGRSQKSPGSVWPYPTTV
jgi:hypothetical protein